MKKILCILFTVAMLASLCACAAGPDVPTAAAEPAAAPDVASAPEPAPAAADTEPIVITFASFHMENELDTVHFTKPWLEAIEKACADKGYDVQFECYWGGSLCSVVDSYQAVVDGTADMALFLTAMPGVFELEQALMFAWNGKTIENPSELFETLYNEFPEIQQEYAAVHPVGFFMEPPQKVNSNKKFENLAESKGQIWTSTGSVCSLIANQWGWSPTSISPDEMYSSLERGIIEGSTSTAKTLVSNAWNEVLKYRYMNFAMTNQMISVLMNQAKWDSLPADVQGILNEYSSGGSWGAGSFFCNAMVEIEDEYEPKLFEADGGMEAITLSDEALAEFQAGIDAAADVWAKDMDAKGMPGTAIIERVRALVNEKAK